MTTTKTKLENAAEMMVESAKGRIDCTREDIIHELAQLADRASRYLAQMKAEPDLCPSEFAKLNPELVRLIDRHTQECNLYRAVKSLEGKIIAETAAAAVAS